MLKILEYHSLTVQLLGSWPVFLVTDLDFTLCMFVGYFLSTLNLNTQFKVPTYCTLLHSVIPLTE